MWQITPGIKNIRCVGERSSLYIKAGKGRPKQQGKKEFGEAQDQAQKGKLFLCNNI
jgi:hypothetical protein